MWLQSPSHEPAPIKLCLPIVSVVAADSKRKERLDLDLLLPPQCSIVDMRVLEIPTAPRFLNISRMA